MKAVSYNFFNEQVFLNCIKTKITVAVANRILTANFKPDNFLFSFMKFKPSNF